jgi:hypothetical protein
MNRETEFQREQEDKEQISNQTRMEMRSTQGRLVRKALDTNLVAAALVKVVEVLWGVELEVLCL